MIIETLGYFDYSINGEQGKMAYRLWSSKNSTSTKRIPVICAHGVTQNSRHMTELAKRLARDFDVYALDFPGRGLSDYFSNKLNYSNTAYAPLCQSFIEAQGFDAVYWIGTSMGGITGIILASQPQTRIAKLVLNDIGPIITVSTMQTAERAAKGIASRFISLEQAYRKIGKYLSDFGLTDQHMMENFMRAGLRQGLDGTWRFDVDPEVYAYTHIKPELNTSEVPFWHCWEQVACPVLVLHGVKSEALTPEIIAGMRKTRPGLTVIDIPDAGHAPHLMSDEQAGWISKWCSLS
jgi:pimeloyl-ACP methyl ester carboxylesterase